MSSRRPKLAKTRRDLQPAERPPAAARAALQPAQPGPAPGLTVHVSERVLRAALLAGAIVLVGLVKVLLR